MSRALESITIIASDFCEDIGDTNERHHLRYQKKLLKAYKKLNLYVCPEIEVVSEIFPNNGEVQYELPCDFVYETKVGIRHPNGAFVTLDLKRDLKLSNKKYTDSEIQAQINGCFDGSIIGTEFMPFYNCHRAGNFVGELYGMGCGFHSNQWYNIQDGILEIGSLIPDDVEIVVEYKSNGLKSEGFRLVPTEIVPYLENQASMLFYEHSDPNKSLMFDVKAKAEYYRVKKLYSYRTPEYLGFLFKSGDRPSRM